MRGDKMISTSFLSIKDNLKENILKLDLTTTDFLHVDIMDGCFVDNNTASFDVYEEYLKDLNTPLDVHLMVKDVIKYVDLYKKLNPVIITFHYEACENNVDEIINLIKSFDKKVGISIKPKTSPEVLFSYLNKVRYQHHSSLESASMQNHYYQKYLHPRTV